MEDTKDGFTNVAAGVRTLTVHVTIIRAIDWATSSAAPNHSSAILIPYLLSPILIKRLSKPAKSKDIFTTQFLHACHDEMRAIAFSCCVKAKTLRKDQPSRLHNFDRSNIGTTHAENNFPEFHMRVLLSICRDPSSINVEEAASIKKQQTAS